MSRFCWNLNIRGIELPALLAVLVVAAIRAIVTQDVGFGDEVGYLNRGQDISLGLLPGFSLSATYVDLYFLLSKASSDPIGLYFAMRAVAAVSFVLGVWVAARLLVGPLLAWTGAATAVALPVAYVWPGVAGPSAGALLVGFALFARYRSLASLAAAAALFWLAAGSRPEFTWLALVSSITSLVWLVVEFRTGATAKPNRVPNFLAVLVGALGIPTVLVFLHGSPFGGGRSWVAFSQHFSLRNSFVGEDPWLDWTEIVGRSFPGAQSVGQALLNNPSVFVSHLFSNIAEFPTFLIHQVLGGPTITSLMVVVLLVSVLVSVGMQPRMAFSRLRGKVRRYRGGIKKIENIVFVIVGILFLVAIMIPILVIYPRAHYLVVPAGLLILFVLVIQSQFGSTKMTAVLPFAISFLLFVLLTGQVIQDTIGRMSYPAHGARSMSLMRDADTDWKIFASGWDVYQLITFVDRAEIIYPEALAPGQDLEEFFAQAGINAVWMNEDLTNFDPSLLPGLDVFLQNPENFGFTPIHPYSNIYVRVE
jgi:hypothetical protein